MINARLFPITRETQLLPRVQFSRVNDKPQKNKKQKRILNTAISKTPNSKLFLSVYSMAIQPVQKPSFILTSGASGRINALLSMRALRSFGVLLATLLMVLIEPFRGRRRLNPMSIAGSSREKSKDEKHEGRNEESSFKKGPVLRVPAGFVPSQSAVDNEVAARRSTAVRRVMQDKDERTVRDFSLFDTIRGDTIFTQSWTPVCTRIRGVVVLLHGLNEHSGRYSEFAKQLNANGFKVYAMDWIGHGGSDGLHAYVHSLNDAVADTKSFLEKVLAGNPGIPCFCFGHSTGGAIVLKAALDPKLEDRLAGIILTSPAIGVQPSHPILFLLAPVLSLFLPRHQFGVANKKGMPVSRDPEALVAKYSDPLVYTGSIRIRTGSEILRIASYLQQNMRRLKVPFLVLHGTADTVTDPEASQRLYLEASSLSKTIKLFDGLLHDLLFEPEREAIVQDIIEWLDSRIKS